MEQDVNNSPSNTHQRVNRVRLDPHSWSQAPPVRYSPLSNPAPPSYTDTIQADQEVQLQLLQEVTSSIHNQSSTEQSLISNGEGNINISSNDE